MSARRCYAMKGVTGRRVTPLESGDSGKRLRPGVSLEATAGPFDSPVHLVLGAFLLLGFVLGAGLVQKARRRGLLA
ncbi:hypothetical protein [Natronococcus pandeyae]|uniref:hypothetical protein n=1 Tax=Natronococcus pandeyae TaxID=2055836 RepID=UPI001652F2E9|nr:hypothetical protein [Natronococcus pandeyae]